jgi:hypothetical protein
MAGGARLVELSKSAGRAKLLLSRRRRLKINRRLGGSLALPERILAS